MSIYALPDPDDDHQDLITEARARFLADLAAGIAALDRAGATLDQLRAPTLADIELVDGRDGRDLSVLLEDCIRYGRAAYAVMHAVIDKETP